MNLTITESAFEQLQKLEIAEGYSLRIHAFLTGG